MSAWCIKLGIKPERIEPGKPQQNAKHERMHRTLKKYTIIPPAQSFKVQQAHFDEFKRAFNEERPHESLKFIAPFNCYQASGKKFPDNIEPPYYPGFFDVRKII